MMRLLILLVGLLTANPIIDDDKFINKRSIEPEVEKFDMFGEKIEISLK